MKLIRSFKYALTGIKSCFKSEPNFRIHSLLAMIALLISALIKISTIEWVAVCFCIAFVIAMEMVNTSIEKLCDIIHKEKHIGIKKVKDIAAGAVLISAIFSLATGSIIFLPKLIRYFKIV